MILFHLPNAVIRDSAVESWIASRVDEPGARASWWFQAMRQCGDDVREVLHDGRPTACVGTAAFGYVDAFTAHANVGFFHGADLQDPHGLLSGTGKRMRHVKLMAEEEVDEQALALLIKHAYEVVRKLVLSG